MLLRITSHVCWVALAVLTASCGGGGDGDAQQGPAPYRLTFNPATATATFEAGSSQTLNVHVTIDRVVSEVVNVAVIDAAGVLSSVTPLTLSALGPQSYSATLWTSPALAVGRHQGTLQIKLCRDNPAVCSQPLPGSPWSLPYDFTVQEPPPAPVPGVTFSPSAVNVSAYLDELPAVSLTASISNAFPVYPQFVDANEVFQPNPPVSNNGSSVTATLYVSPTLAPGSYQGQVALRLCRDLPCSSQFPGSPFVVPYSVTVSASINLTPLAPWAGVSEWAQHQGNAAHNGHVPVTLNPSAFNRRWKWTIPNAPSQSVSLTPVVSSNGHVYAVSSGYFAPSSVYAISESDSGLAWRRDFGTIFAANPPSTDGGMVYLATSGHSDTFMWAFNGASGALGFRTAFNSQWEHYFAPTIANGSVYTNGGYYGGMYSFDQASGVQNWFAGLSQYDQWTPTVNSTYAFAFMPNGLNVVNVSDGSAAFVITDPNNAVQPYSVFGAPMLGSSNNVVVVNGSGFSGTNRLINFDLAARNIRWSVPGVFRHAPALANGVIYTINGAQLEARSEANGNLLWGWFPDEATTDPFGTPYGSASYNVIATDNLVFVSTRTRVYAISLATHQPVWSYGRPGTLALSPQGVLYITTNGSGPTDASIIAFNVN